MGLSRAPSLHLMAPIVGPGMSPPSRSREQFLGATRVRLTHEAEEGDRRDEIKWRRDGGARLG